MSSKSKTGKNTTPQQRLEQFTSAKLHVDGDRLFCTSCNLVVDHERKSSVQAHLRTAKHEDSKRKYEESATSKAQPLSEYKFNSTEIVLL